MNIGDKLAKVDESVTVQMYDNGFMLEAGGRNKKGDYVNAKILCNTLEELNSKEIELISVNNTICPNGYNVMKGGDNYERTDEHKIKIGNALRGKRNRMNILKI